MMKIAEMLDGKLESMISYNCCSVTVSLSRLRKVISYFHIYSLKTKKSIAFFNWLKAYNLVINKEHFNENGLNRIKLLMNKKK